MEKDYSHLEGKVIIYDNTVKQYQGKVALIDPDIGITIVNAENEKDYLSCLVLPSSPKWTDGMNEEKARKDFEKRVKEIENGKILIIPTPWQELFGSTPTENDCPF